MGKMTAEKAAKMLAEEGMIVTNEEATQIVDFLRKLARVAISQYLRDDGHPPNPTPDNTSQKAL
jgi:hypothetical protein